MPFDTSALEHERKLLDQPVPAIPGVRGFAIGPTVIAVAAAIVVLVLALLAWLVLRGRARGRERAEVALSLEPEPGTAVARESTGVPSAQARPAIPRASQPIVSEEIMQLGRDREDIRQKAYTLASTEPDATAQLLRAWLVKTKALSGVGSHGS